MLKNVDRWLGSYFSQSFRPIRSLKEKKPIHIIFACVDHYEPDWNKADPQTQRQRVERWVHEFPLLAKKHKDADGCHPRHSFFYPAEVYTKDYFNLLKELCDAGWGEVDIHFHHDGDTEETFKKKMEQAIKDFSSHGFLGRRVLSGQIRFAFVHGNWALNNSRKDGRWCGVNNETKILSDLGCYADFTYPSAPSETQPKKINSLYYCRSNAQKPKAHNSGVDASVGKFVKGDLLLVQGPLTLNWRNRAKGVFPRIENGELSGANPPTPERVDLWIDQHIHVQGKPEWVFVKVYTHGAPEKNAQVLLGEPMDKMYQYLEERYNDGVNYQLHYASAREMYNMIKAAEAGESGAPGAYRNYLIERGRA